MSRLSTALVAALAATLFGTACDGAKKPAVAGAPAKPSVARLEAGDGTTLDYQMENVWGEIPTAEARRHLVRVLEARLAAIGEDRARVTTDETGVLLVTVTADSADAAAAEIERDAEVRFRIRAPAEIENSERDLREKLGEFYAVSRPDFDWFPLGDVADVFLYIPDAPIMLELGRLHAAEPRDPQAIEAATERLKAVLLQRVFTGADLSNAEAVHRPGDSAVRVTIRPERRPAFGKFTSHYQGRQMMVIVNGQVISAPTITEPLESAAELRSPEGSFTPAAADAFAALLRRAAYGIRLTRSQ